MNTVTNDKISARMIETENAYDRLCKTGEYYDVFMTSSELGRYLATINSFLMTDKIELDEYTELYNYYSKMSSKILARAMELDNKLYEERRNNETE